MRKQKTETIRVRVADLHIDDAGYQRTPQSSWVKQLAAQIERIADVPFPVVSVRDDGSVWVLDGGHRITAISQKWGPETIVTCRAHYGLTYEQEARMFNVLNQELKLKAYNTFHSLVLAGDDQAIAIAKSLSNVGLTYGPATNMHMVGAVNALQAVQRRGVLDETLHTLVTAWGFQRAAWDGYLLNGMGMFIQRYPDADLSSLAQKLGKGGSPDTFIGNAKDYSKVVGVSIPRGIGFMLHRTYNTRRGASTQLPPW